MEACLVNDFALTDLVCPGMSMLYPLYTILFVFIFFGQHFLQKRSTYILVYSYSHT